MYKHGKFGMIKKMINKKMIMLPCGSDKQKKMWILCYL